MSLRVARRARVAALVVPGLWSLTVWVLAGGAAVAAGAWLLVAGGLGLAVLAGSELGECCLARVLGGRVPRVHQRHTLAPVAAVLLGHGVVVDGLLLLVGPGHGMGVTAVGERTVVVTRGLVEAVRSGRLAPATAASMIAHELGVVKAGMTRRAVAWTVFLLPWSALVGFLALMWGIVTVFVPAPVMVASMGISAGAGLWLGFAEHPLHLASTLVMGVAAWTWWSSSLWNRARNRVGDDYLARVGLAKTFAAYLSTTGDDDSTRDRAVRLQHQPASSGPYGCGPSGITPPVPGGPNLAAARHR